MQKANHPHLDKRLTVTEYIQDFGQSPYNPKDLPRCPVCEQRVSPRAVSTTASTGHFAHGPKSNFCPLKTDGATLYHNRLPKKPDFEAARAIRSMFRLNWKKHFRQLDWIVKSLDINEFTGLIRLANQQRIWEYAKLQEFQLPYVFATLTEFPPANSWKQNGVPKRRCWFRCWFDDSVQCYDDLWIHRSKPLLFWRAWYNLPEGKRRPRAIHLQDAYSLELDGQFLEKDRIPAEYVQNKIESWLNQNFQAD